MLQVVCVEGTRSIGPAHSLMQAVPPVQAVRTHLNQQLLDQIWTVNSDFALQFSFEWSLISLCLSTA